MRETSEAPADRVKRLLHRSHYRGQLEADILFGRFADANLPRLSGDQLDRYEALIDESDADLLAWVMLGRQAPARHDNDVLAMLRAFEPRT